MSNVSSDRKALSRSSIVGDDAVTNGSVDNYDFDWGEEVRTREVDVCGGCNCHLNEETIQVVEEEPRPAASCSCETPIKTNSVKATAESKAAFADADYEIIDL